MKRQAPRRVRCAPEDISALREKLLRTQERLEWSQLLCKVLLDGRFSFKPEFKRVNFLHRHLEDVEFDSDGLPVRTERVEMQLKFWLDTSREIP